MEGLGFGFTVSLNDLFSNPLENMINKFKKLEGVSQDVVKKVERQFDNFNIGQNLAIGGTLLASPLVVATSAAMDFEAQLSSIKAVAGEGIDMSAIQKTALDAGSQTAFSALEAAKGMEELIKAGIDATTVINGGLVPALNLATAGELSVAEAAEIASTGVNAFGLEKSAASIERVGNALSGAANASATSVRELKLGMSAVATVAAGMNFTLEDTTLGLAILAQNGLKSSDAGTSLKTMLQNLQPDTKESIQLFKELGIITNDNKNQFLTAEGRFKSMGEIAQVLQDRLGKLSIADRAKALEKMFGTDAVRAANIFFTQGAAGFNAMSEASKQFTMESIAAERLNNLKGSVEMLKGSFETLLINVGMQLTPIFKRLVDFVTPAVNLFNDFAKTTVGQTAIKITAAISGLLIVLGLGIMAQSAFNIVSLTAVPILTSWASSMGLATTSMSAFVISALPLIATVGVIVGGIALLVKSWQSFDDVLNGGKSETGFLGFMQKLGGVMFGIVEVFQTANSMGFSIGENLHNALQKVGVLDTVVAIGTWIVRIKELFSGFMSAFDKVSFEPIVNAFDRLFNIFTRFDTTLATNTTSLKTWQTIGWFVGNLVETIFRGVVFAIENVVNWVTFTTSILVTLVSGFVNFGITVYDLFKQWWSGGITIKELFFGVAGAIKTYFIDTFTGIWRAFQELINSFAKSIATLPFGEKLLSMLGVNTVALGVKEAAKPSMLAVPTNQFAIGNTLESQRGGIVTPNDQLLSNSTAAVLKNQTIRNEFYQNNLTPTAPIVNVQGNNQPTEVIVELDGDRVGKAVINRINENGARQ